jgi:hypothetical protein
MSNSNQKRSRSWINTLEQRQSQYERMQFRRGNGHSTGSTTSSLTSHTQSLLVERFGSSTSQSTISLIARHLISNELSQLESIVATNDVPISPHRIDSNEHPFEDIFDVFLENMSHFIDSRIEYDNHYTDSANNFSIENCFDLLDHGVLPSKPLMEYHKICVSCGTRCVPDNSIYSR